jgi:hypothetical protein
MGQHDGDQSREALPSESISINVLVDIPRLSQIPAQASFRGTAGLTKRLCNPPHRVDDRAERAGQRSCGRGAEEWLWERMGRLWFILKPPIASLPSARVCVC